MSLPIVPHPNTQAGFGKQGAFDKDIYNGGSRGGFAGEVVDVQSTPAHSSLRSSNQDTRSKSQRLLSSYAAKNKALEETKGAEVDPFAASRASRVADNEDNYHQRRLDRSYSPVRADFFGADGDKTPAVNVRTYRDVMLEQQLAREEEQAMRDIQKKEQELEEQKKFQEQQEALNGKRKETTDTNAAQAKRGRWDQSSGSSSSSSSSSGGMDWDATPLHTSSSSSSSSSRSSRWDATPSHVPSASSSKRVSRWDATPSVSDMNKPATSRWDATPSMPSAAGGVTATPSGRKRSRWDETPMQENNQLGDMTPAVSNAGMQTPAGMNLAGMATPMTSQVPMTPEQITATRYQQEIDMRNRPLTDEELDDMLPGPEEGFEILIPPEGYKPIRTPSRKLMMTPTPMGHAGGAGGYMIPQVEAGRTYDIPDSVSAEGVNFTKPEDHQYFGKLLDDVDEDSLSKEEAIERKIMTLLLKVKNGAPPQRKSAMKQLTKNARVFGAGPLFNQILPLLMSPTIEDQERHLLIKVIDRILFKLDDLVRPYVHKILVVIEPLLIDEDYYARVEGREIISNLAKAAGLATMIATMRPDIDNVDEYVRNTTARAFAVVASALGIHQLLPFLKAVCQSKKSWQARHTGIKICQQISILMGCAILPHLRSLVEIIEHGLTDEQSKVRCITALALSSLAEAAAPYGIESFDSVFRPLWKGIQKERSKTLAAFLKAIGYIIPLMDAEHASWYTKEVMVVVIREFASPDEEMKKIVLKVVKQCVATDGVTADYVKEEILPAFFRNFWIRRMAMDRRNYRQVVSTTTELANKVGCSEIITRIADDLKDDNEPYRRMVLETVEKTLAKLGAGDIDQRLEEVIVDGILYAFQEQSEDDTRVVLNAFGVVVNALGTRCKVYLPQICGIIKWRLNNKQSMVRQQAADLVARIAVVMKKCDEEQLLSHLGMVLYEYLGEEYPEVLGSILGALKAVVNVVGMERMTPPIKDLLPRLVPVLKNRHEKVQENCIDLVGRIADRGAEYVSGKEWMRICFELLELLKAKKKSIRRASVNTFGYIAKAIGPQDVLATLLNNLKVQERQNRVCTTVAIAIVAETCSPFTVLPALMNEYRVPELNVRNGVLKAMSFLFEYIGEMGRDYVYAVTPLLVDALQDRDIVHRQTAAAVVKHMSLGVVGLSREDAMVHLLNHVWPNIFESTAHLITNVCDVIEGMRAALGPTKVLQYVVQGLFHPARKVRVMYWRIFNTLYVGAAEALIAGYPRIADSEIIIEEEDDGENDGEYEIEDVEDVKKGSYVHRNTYTRHELEVFI